MELRKIAPEPEMRKRAQHIARQINMSMLPGWNFALIAIDETKDGNTIYISNLEKRSIISAFRQVADNLEKELDDNPTVISLSGYDVQENDPLIELAGEDELLLKAANDPLFRGPFIDFIGFRFGEGAGINADQLLGEFKQFARGFYEG